MLSGRHPTALRFSRPLLHLVSLAIASGVIVSMFGLAAFALLDGRKEMATGSLVDRPVRTESPSLLDVPVARSDPAPATTETNSSNIAAAKLPPPFSAQDPPTSEAPLAEKGAEPALEPLSPDPDGAAAVVEPAPGVQSAGETRPPEAQSPPPAQPAPPVDQPNPPPDAPLPATAKSKILITDQERDEMFHTFEAMREKQLSGSEKANATPTRKPIAKDERNDRFGTSLLARNTGSWYRVRRECGPIKDPVLYHQCLATFTTHYR